MRDPVSDDQDAAASRAVPGADAGSGDPAALELRLFGPLSARRGGLEIDLGGRRQKAVLGVLLVARGGMVSSERLIDLIWGDAAPPSAPGALHAYVSHLRRRLEPDRVVRSGGSVIAREGTGYACRVADGAVDSWRFERLVAAGTAAQDPAAARRTLEEALALYRAPALAEYAGESWAQAEARRLAELRAAARERLLDLRLRAGESAMLIPELEALVAEEPLREERWRLLTLALYRSQRQADALATLRRARTLLAEELGVDPGRPLRDLEAMVLEQSPSLDAPARPAPDVPAVPGPTPSTSGRPADQARPAVAGTPRAGRDDVLIDRGREVVELEASVDDALDGRGGVVLVQGPAGIGKSRLLTEVRRLAADRSALVLSARGSQLEKEFGFGAVRQLFEPRLADPAGRRDLLAGSASSAAIAFDGVAAVDVDHSDASFAVLHGLYWLTVNLASRGPVVVVIDDLQWCDPGSLRFLAYLAGRLDGLRVLVVATLRTGEEHADAALLAELVHGPTTVAIRPGPLSLDGVADLVRRRLSPDAHDTFVAACHRTTGGNPLLLRQLLRALEADGVRPDALHVDTVTAIGSRAVSSIVLMRLARMPAAATAVARAIAVLGDAATMPAVAELTGLLEPETAAAIAALARVEIVRPELPLGFVHPLVRDAVYLDLPPGERELHHERAARALHGRDAAAEQVAAHLLHVPSRGDPWVVDVLRGAASIAADRGAAESAVAYLTRALEEQPAAAVRAGLLVQLGRVESHADGSAAIDHLREAHAMMTDPAERATVAQLLSQLLIFAGARGTATAFARQSATSLPAELSDERQGLVALERLGGFMHNLDPEVWRRGDADVTGDGPGARMLAVATAWDRFIDGEDREAAVALARFGLADGVLQRSDPGLFWVVAANILDMAGEEVGPFWDDALAQAHARGSGFAALSVHLWGGHRLLWRGELRDAERSLQRYTEMHRRWGGRAIGTPYGDAFRVELALERGDVERARAVMTTSSSSAAMGEGGRLLAEAEVRLLVAEDDPERALVLLDSLRTNQQVVRNPVWRPWRSLRAGALAALGRRTEAEGLVEEELALARRWGAPRGVGRTLRLLGELRGSAGVADLRGAVDVLSTTTARLEHARALHALGQVVTDQAEAVVLLRRALELAELCGADALRRETGAALQQRGVAVAAHPAPAMELDSTERRIGALAAQGVEDRLIAQELFLTPHSVRLTLDGVRRRLGARSDQELRVLLDA